MTEQDDTREYPTDPEAEVAPPDDTPDALDDDEIDEIRAAEEPAEDDPYSLRSGLRPEGSDSDPASQLNF